MRLDLSRLTVTRVVATYVEAKQMWETSQSIYKASSQSALPTRTLEQAMVATTVVAMICRGLPGGVNRIGLWSGVAFSETQHSVRTRGSRAWWARNFARAWGLLRGDDTPSRLTREASTGWRGDASAASWTIGRFCPLTPKTSFQAALASTFRALQRIRRLSSLPHCSTSTQYGRRRGRGLPEDRSSSRKWAPARPRPVGSFAAR